LRLGEAADWLKFGFKASAHRILFHVYTNVDYYVVGYLFGRHAAGVYANAYLIVLEPARFIAEVVQSTAFPAFSRLKRTRPALVEQFLALTRMNMVVLMGFLGAVFVAAEDILTLIGPEWAAGAPAARILCLVGVLRGLSFVVPPLLDGTGYPGRTLIYTSVAAVVVPGFFIVFGALLGDRLGYVSVAYAWAAGYPIAFAVLFAMGLAVLEMKARTLLSRVGGIAVLAAIAACAAAAVAWLARPLPLAARLLLVIATMLLGFGLLLARFEGITPRSVGRALRS
jgi:O-antigen/teichoic acid export membrane protein